MEVAGDIEHAESAPRVATDVPASTERIRDDVDRTCQLAALEKVDRGVAAFRIAAVSLGGTRPAIARQRAVVRQRRRRVQGASDGEFGCAPIGIAAIAADAARAGAAIAAAGGRIDQQLADVRGAVEQLKPRVAPEEAPLAFAEIAVADADAAIAAGQAVTAGAAASICHDLGVREVDRQTGFRVLKVADVTPGGS